MSAASAGLLFFQLPVAVDQGLPQAFSCVMGATSYDFGVYASINVAEGDPPETQYNLAVPTAGRPGLPIRRAIWCSDRPARAPPGRR